jgi:hypothetical protein
MPENTPEQQKSWEEEFDDNFDGTWSHSLHKRTVKAFISRQITEAERRTEEKAIEIVMRVIRLNQENAGKNQLKLISEIARQIRANLLHQDPNTNQEN